MSVRMRHTRAHTNNRRSHHALEATKSVVDKESGNRRLPHRVDESTGMYRGKKIFEPKVKKAAEPKAKQTHHLPAQADEHVHEAAKSEAKPAEVREAEQSAKATARPRSRSGFGGGA